MKPLEPQDGAIDGERRQGARVARYWDFHHSKGHDFGMGLPFISKDEGVLARKILLLVFGLIFVLVGIIAEQVAQLRRAQITED